MNGLSEIISFEMGICIKPKTGEILSVRDVEFSFLPHAISVIQEFFGSDFNISDINKYVPPGDEKVSIDYNFRLDHDGYPTLCKIQLKRSDDQESPVRYFGVNGDIAHIEKNILRFSDSVIKVPDYQDTMIKYMVDAIRGERNPFMNSRDMVINQTILHVLMGDLKQNAVPKYRSIFDDRI